jgi:alpha-galactosidase
MTFTPERFESAQTNPYILESGPNQWVLGNRLVRRHLRFDALGLQTLHWWLEDAEFNFAQPLDAAGQTAGEFGFSVNGQPMDGRSSMRLLHHHARTIAREGMELRLQFALLDLPLELDVIYAVYRDFPAIRKRLRITNRGTDAITLTRVAFEMVNLEPGTPKHLQLFGRYATEDRELFYTGRVDDPCVRLEDSSSGLGVAVLNEAPGYLKRTMLMSWNPFWGARVNVGYDTDLFPFECRLMPEDSLETAAASVLLYKGFDAALVTRYASDILSRQGHGFRAPIQYNTWPGFQWQIEETSVLEQVPLAAQIGTELFCVDEGWGTFVGANQVSSRFPNQLENIRGAVEAHGMRLGLWTSMATVDARATPPLEWAARERDGSVKITQTAEGPAVVMCLASAYRDHAAERILELVRRYNLAYLKLDLTTIFNAYGESPGCHACGHDHASWAESLFRTYEGVRYVCERITSACPEVLLDLTFELWGHKHVIDYGLLMAGDLDWLSNVGDPNAESGAPRQIRTLLYQRALTIPTERMLIGNLQAESGDPLPRIATTIGSAALLSGDLRRVKLEHLEVYRRIFAWFKRLRSKWLLERFVALGEWQAPKVTQWDGYARLTMDGQGFIAVFRNESHNPDFELRLEVPAGRYRLCSVVSDFSLEISAQSLGIGIHLEFPRDSRVELFELRAVTTVGVTNSDAAARLKGFLQPIGARAMKVSFADWTAAGGHAAMQALLNVGFATLGAVGLQRLLGILRSEPTDPNTILEPLLIERSSVKDRRSL